MNDSKFIDRGLRLAVVVALASRFVLVVVGYLAISHLGITNHGPSRNFVYHDEAPLLLEMWARWDSEWYLLIADHGYDSGTYVDRTALALEGGPVIPTAGFFPLYPLVVRLASWITGDTVLAGVLVSNLSFLIFVVALYKLVRLDHDENVSFRAVLYYCIYPASIFFSAVYAEALFMMCVVGSIYSFRRERYYSSAILALLASLTRPLGVFLALLYLVELYRSREKALEKGLCAFGAVSGPVLFFGYCWYELGSFLAPVYRQSWWRGSTEGPWKAFVRFFQDEPGLFGLHNSVVDFTVAVLFLLCLYGVFKKLRLSYFCYAVPTVMLPLCSSTLSYTRLSLASFPVFIVLALVGENRRLHHAITILMMVALFLFMLMFASWNWVN